MAIPSKNTILNRKLASQMNGDMRIINISEEIKIL